MNPLPRIALEEWQERYAGGSKEAEDSAIDGFATDILTAQKQARGKHGKGASRTLHAKILVGVRNARVDVDPGLPPELAAGYFQPGARLLATVRLSNASPFYVGDAAPDMRGAAIRIHLEKGRWHDLLMTSYPVSHARSAWQFIRIAVIATGPKLLIVPRLFLTLGVSETLRVLDNFKSSRTPIESLAVQRFWSRSATLWGQAGPVRYSLIPDAVASGAEPDKTDPEFLASEFGQRLSAGDVTYRLALQRFVSEARTPVEDGATEWLEWDSPFIDVAKVTIPSQDLGSVQGRSDKASVDATAFNPWNSPDPFRPLGNLNRARGRVYDSSAKGWLGSAVRPPGD